MVEKLSHVIFPHNYLFKLLLFSYNIFIDIYFIQSYKVLLKYM